MQALAAPFRESTATGAIPETTGRGMTYDEAYKLVGPGSGREVPLASEAIQKVLARLKESPNRVWGTRTELEEVIATMMKAEELFDVAPDGGLRHICAWRH